MLAPLLAVSAVIPSLLLVLYFHRRDLYPEPGKVIWATFGLGIATIPGVLIVALPVAAVLKGIPDAHVAGLCGAFLTAAIPEEFFKLLVVRFYAARHAAFDEPMDGVVYGAVASLGFATLENVLYVTSGGVGVAVLRAFTAVPAHAFMGAIMGYYIGRAKFHPEERVRAGIMAYFVPMILHGLYDYPVLTLRELSERGLATDAALPVLPITLAALLTLWIWAIRGLRRARADQDRGHASRVAGAPLVAPVPPAFPAPVAPVGPFAPPAHAPVTPAFSMAPAHRPAAPVHGPGWVGGTILLVLGLLTTSVGGLVTLGVGYSLAMGQVPPWEQNQTILGVVLIGVLPLLAGFVMFALGLRSLNRASVAAAALAPAR
jgi:RsiW-degrading membrane proteinase PrsW (M82 family)